MARAVVLATAVLTLAAAPAQESGRWRLAVSVSTPQPVGVTDAKGRSQAFWWSFVELRNEGEEARSLVLAVRMLTETKKIAPAVFRPDVEERIRAELPAEDKEIRNVVVSTGEIGPGETKKFLAVFQDVDPLATRLDVRVAGAAAAVMREGAHWTAETREWSTVFHRPGDEFDVWKVPLRRVKEEWVLISSRRLR
jgi:hypothetical protein